MVQLFALTEREVEAIHQATLRILSEVGVVLTQAEAREILGAAGATLRGERVLFPPELVEQTVAQCPPQLSVRGRGGTTVTLGDGALHWHNLGGAPLIYDHASGQRRPAVVQDVRDTARLLDGLPYAHSITPFFTPDDVPGPLMSLAMYRHTLPYTTKPVYGPGVQTAAEVDFVVRMAEVIGPPPEMLMMATSPVSPLILPDDVAESVIAIARHGLPLGPLPCPTAGATAPLTIAGAVAQQSAEVLATVVLAQLVKPGLPVVYCGRLAMMEPRTGLSVWGGVELGLLSAATVQVAHRYGLPVNVYGFSSNAHALEVQNGFERSLNALVPALAGADELSGIGEMEAGVMGSFAQMVCDNEIAASVDRLRRGLTVDENALAVDVVAEAMDGERNFLAFKHTARALRAGEVLLTRLAERRAWDEWQNTGRDNMAERAQAEAARLLAEHEVTPLAPEQERELDAIMQTAHEALAA